MARGPEEWEYLAHDAITDADALDSRIALSKEF
jgi:hypothetical protein